MDNRRGCLGGLLELFLLDRIFNWAQRSFGFGRGCSGGCCGIILLVVFVMIFTSILFGTNWFHFGL